MKPKNDREKYRKKCIFGAQKPPKMSSKINKKTKRKQEEKKRGTRGAQTKTIDSHSWGVPVIRGDFGEILDGFWKDFGKIFGRI